MQRGRSSRVFVLLVVLSMAMPLCATPADATPAANSPYNIPNAVAPHDPQQNIAQMQVQINGTWSDICTAWVYGRRQTAIRSVPFFVSYFSVGAHCVYGHNPLTTYGGADLEFPTRLLVHHYAPTGQDLVCQARWKHVSGSFPSNWTSTSAVTIAVVDGDSAVLAADCNAPDNVFPVVAMGNPREQNVFSTQYPGPLFGMWEDHDSSVTILATGLGAGDGLYYHTDVYSDFGSSGAPVFRFYGNVGAGYSQWAVAGQVSGGVASLTRSTYLKWFGGSDIGVLKYWRDTLDPLTGA